VDGGGWIFAVTDPNGVWLHGHYGGEEGLWVPPGTAGVFGEYVVHLTAGESGRAKDQFIMRFQSQRPIIARADGVVSFQCALRHPVWGEGVAEVTSSRSHHTETSRPHSSIAWRCQLAAKIHRSLLPVPVGTDAADVDVRYQPIDEVGGDYCQVHIGRGPADRPTVAALLGAIEQ
jgi:hypothetical protein